MKAKPATGTPLLAVTDVTKAYGRVVALNGASIELRAGECHALIGDNGAGKSTLVKVISGVVVPDSGTIAIDGIDVAFAAPNDARAAGVETVYQDLAIALHLNAFENVFLGRELKRPGLLGLLGVLDRRAMRARTTELLTSLNARLQSAESPVGSYSGGQRQAVAIARSIAWGQRILILDEPTAALGVPQKKMVLDLIARLRRERPEMGIILITHDLPHVFEIADRVTVMRQGRSVATHRTADTTEHELIATITGATP
ncbi:MAG: ATP-binding cassette domain-containing protein [Microbacteriaceae bacterium]